jgi:hypothetical protein
MALEDSLKYDNLTLPEGPAFRPVSLNPTMLIRMIDMKGLVTVNGRSRLEKERLWTRLS